MPGLFLPDTIVGLPATKVNAIPYEIESVSPGPRTQWVPRANQTTIQCRIRSADYPVWITDMVGSVAPALYLGKGVLTRGIPEQCPYISGGAPATLSGTIGGQWCTRAEQVDSGGTPLTLDGAGGGPAANVANGWPAPRWERYRCTFEGMPFAVVDDATAWTAPATNAPEMYRYVIRSRKSKVKEQQIPAGALYFAGTVPLTKIPTVSLYVRFASADVQYTWTRVPVANIPIKTALALENTVNFGTWDRVPTTGYYWPDGTLRFAGYDDTDKYYDAAGNWVCDLVYYFEYRNIGLTPAGIAGGWNWYFLPSLGGGGHVVPMSIDGLAQNPTGPGGGNCLYPASDFNDLFRPET